ncbi:hypothetical protein ACHAWF_003362 [Thalassiosira exigua]
MAINDLPTPTEPSPRQPLRSYREAASHLARCHGPQPHLRPVVERKQAPSPPSSSPPPCGSPPRLRAGPSPPSTRCRSRTPSPPKPPSSSSTAGKSKAPRSVSPGGTPASSAGAASRAAHQPPQERTKAVRWASLLVSSVRSRPRTPREYVPLLFYSRADERRFRKEAEAAAQADRREEFGIEQLEDDSLASLSDDEEDPRGSTDREPLWSPKREHKDYAISKAVVVFGGSARTYGAGGGCAVEAALGATNPTSSEAFSFDDAAFWNGQLTWS